MGIWEVIGSTTEAVKRNVPDLTPLKNATRAPYDYGSAACTWIDRAVRTNFFQGLTQRLPENKTIGLYSSIIAKHTGNYAIQEGYKLIPGGVAVSKIITNTLDDVRKENLKAEKLQASSQENFVAPSTKVTRERLQGVAWMVGYDDLLPRDQGFNPSLSLSSKL